MNGVEAIKALRWGGRVMLVRNHFFTSLKEFGWFRGVFGVLATWPSGFVFSHHCLASVDLIFDVHDTFCVLIRFCHVLDQG